MGSVFPIDTNAAMLYEFWNLVLYWICLLIQMNFVDCMDDNDPIDGGEL